MFKPDKEKRKKYSLDLVRDGTISIVVDNPEAQPEEAEN